MPSTAIQVSELRKHYGSVVALDGVSFDVPAGTVFGLLGPNGAGKTTIVRILSTILRPDGGSAEVLGRSVVGDPAAVRTLIGLAGQNAAVDSNLTGHENLSLIGKLAQLPWSDVADRANELLRRFDLVGAANRPVRTYSGGMRRRLDVAAALVQRPPVLFLDEPTTGLDIQSRSELWAVIRELVSEGATVLLTTQYLEEADRLADRVAVVDRGRVVANDTPVALKSRLGATVVEIGFANDLEAGRARATLAPLVDHVEGGEDAVVRLASNGDPHVLITILHALEAAALPPISFTVREPSLDDVFLTLTGHAAEGASTSSGELDG